MPELVYPEPVEGKANGDDPSTRSLRDLAQGINFMKKNLLAIILIILILGVSIYFLVKGGETKRVSDVSGLKEAAYYETLAGGATQCNLCPNHCLLAEGQTGLCKVRQNIGGKLYNLAYGKVVSVHLDPIEKKPFFHFLPGSKSYSLATAGCNLRCLYCQNWEIAQNFPEDVKSESMTAEEVVRQALQSNSQSIALTYSEPIAFYEYMLDIARTAKEKGLKVVVVSNGYINQEPLKELLKYIDAIKIDLKGFDEEFYQKFIGGHLQPVLDNLKTIKQSGVWLEIVNLLIPGENDSEEEIRAMSQWIKENLGEEVPLHFSRFYPMYKLQNLPPTPEETVIRAFQIAKETGLKYVYTGNITYPSGETTYCPKSGQVAIKRIGYFVEENNLKNGQCSDGEKIPGVWQRD